MSGAGRLDHEARARDPSAHAAEPAASASAEKTNVKPFLMNSRRLTGPYLMCIAKAIGLPTNGTTDETRVMINGKLAEMGRDPHSV